MDEKGMRRWVTAEDRIALEALALAASPLLGLSVLPILALRIVQYFFFITGDKEAAAEAVAELAKLPTDVVERVAAFVTAEGLLKPRDLLIYLAIAELAVEQGHQDAQTHELVESLLVAGWSPSEVRGAFTLLSRDCLLETGRINAFNGTPLSARLTDWGLDRYIEHTVGDKTLSCDVIQAIWTVHGGERGEGHLEFVGIKPVEVEAGHPRLFVLRVLEHLSNDDILHSVCLHTGEHGGSIGFEFEVLRRAVAQVLGSEDTDSMTHIDRPPDYCCERKQDDLEQNCELHPDPFDCPDRFVIHSASGSYGLIVHDGGSSSILIDYCPWCGSRLA